ncbi:MAG: 6,7-dimethyl-8-ribityllumazine synthase [Sneathiellaceae bacterium]
MAQDPPHLLIVEARFYDDLSDHLAQGTIRAIEAAGGSYDRISVPGALEIPSAIAIAIRAPSDNHRARRYDGFVALGCVIRGETYHFEIVASESARALQAIGVATGAAIGNGILTVETYEQALVRARPDEKDKGGDAARAALSLIAWRRQLGLTP